MSNKNIEYHVTQVQELIECKAAEIIKLLLIAQTQNGEAKRLAGWQLFYYMVSLSTPPISC